MHAFTISHTLRGLAIGFTYDATAPGRAPSHLNADTDATPLAYPPIRALTHVDLEKQASALPLDHAISQPLQNPVHAEAAWLIIAAAQRALERMYNPAAVTRLLDSRATAAQDPDQWDALFAPLAQPAAPEQTQHSLDHIIDGYLLRAA